MATEPSDKDELVESLLLSRLKPPTYYGIPAMWVIIAAIIVAVFALWGMLATALAQETLHSQQYYAQNRGVRDATLGWCQEEVSRSILQDCQNAKAADNERLTSRPTTDPLMDARFWRENPAARDGVLRICAAPNVADRPYLPYCRYAAAGIGR